jgi:competence protein ComEC
MLFPFLFLTLSLTGGILLSALASPSLATGIASMVVCLFCAWIFFSVLRKTRVAFAFILLTAFFLGSSLYTYRNNTFENNPLKKLTAEDYIDFQGRLYKSLSRGHERDYLYLKVEKIISDNQEIKIRGNLIISVLHSQEMAFPQSFLLLKVTEISVPQHWTSISRARIFTTGPSPKVRCLSKNCIVGKKLLSPGSFPS